MLALVLLLAPSWASALPPDLRDEEGRERRAGPFDIRGNGDLLEPDSGVRRGSGTPADPYVIEGWRIAAGTSPFALSIRDTTAHVLVRDVVDADESAGLVPRTEACPTGYVEPCVWASFVVVNASNVVFERIGASNRDVAFALHGVTDVVVRDVVLGGPRWFGPLWNGFVVRDSQRVVLDNVTNLHGGAPVGIVDSADVLVSRFDWHVAPGGPRSFGVVRSERVELRDSDMRGVVAYLASGTRDVAFVDVAFEGWESGIGNFGEDARGIFVCGSSFAGHTRLAAVDLRDARDVALVGNRFEGNAVAVEILGGQNVVFERNLVANSTDIGALLHADFATIHNNSFVNNAWGNAASRGASDARWNWWGDASGPSVDGPGTGDGWRTGEGESFVPFEPWLAAPPELAVDCAAVPRPAVAPALPLVVDAYHAFDRATAALVEFRLEGDAHLTGRVRFYAPTAHVDARSILFIVDYGLDSAFGFQLSMASSRLPSANVSHRGLNLSLDLVEARGGWFGLSLDCRAWSCAENLLVIAGASPGVYRTEYDLEVRASTGASSLVFTFSEDAGLVTARDMREGGAVVSARYYGYGVAYADDARATLSPERALFAFSNVRRPWSFGQASALADHQFTLTRPGGSEEPADGVDIFAGAPGTYEYAFSTLSANEPYDVQVLWADLDVHVPPWPGYDG